MFAIKAEIQDAEAKSFRFDHQKTMYGGKQIAAGDQVFLFASENEGGQGLVAVGVVTSAVATPRRPDAERKTPRVSIAVERQATTKKRLGRAELRHFSDWNDGRAETELNFKFYRQGTNKIVGISEETTKFLSTFF